MTVGTHSLSLLCATDGRVTRGGPGRHRREVTTAISASTTTRFNGLACSPRSSTHSHDTIPFRIGRRSPIRGMRAIRRGRWSEPSTRQAAEIRVVAAGTLRARRRRARFRHRDGKRPFFDATIRSSLSSPPISRAPRTRSFGCATLAQGSLIVTPAPDSMSFHDEHGLAGRHCDVARAPFRRVQPSMRVEVRATGAGAGAAQYPLRRGAAAAAADDDARRHRHPGNSDPRPTPAQGTKLPDSDPATALASMLRHNALARDATRGCLRTLGNVRHSQRRQHVDIAIRSNAAIRPICSNASAPGLAVMANANRVARRDGAMARTAAGLCGDDAQRTRANSGPKRFDRSVEARAGQIHRHGQRIAKRTDRFQLARVRDSSAVTAQLALDDPSESGPHVVSA